MRDKEKIHVSTPARLLNLFAVCWAITLAASTAANGLWVSATLQTQRSSTQSNAPAQPKPPPAPARWRGFIGEYGPDNDILIILEKDGRLWALFKRIEFESLDEVS